MQVLSFSERGNRLANEDFVLSKTWNEFTSIHIIVDGMGGYEHGELAAKTIAYTISEYIHEHLNINNDIECIIKKAIDHSNQTIQKLRAEYNSKMGSTLAGILIDKHQVYCFWVGDVRIYRIQNNKIIFQTKDHSLINELLSKNQTVTPTEIEKYRHIVTKSIQGNIEEIKPEIVAFKNFSKIDTFIICSDGVHNVIGPAEMEMMFQANTDYNLGLSDVKDRCKKEGNDNYSMLVVCIK